MATWSRLIWILVYKTIESDRQWISVSYWNLSFCHARPLPVHVNPILLPIKALNWLRLSAKLCILLLTKLNCFRSTSLASGRRVVWKCTDHYWYLKCSCMVSFLTTGCLIDVLCQNQWLIGLDNFPNKLNDNVISSAASEMLFMTTCKDMDGYGSYKFSQYTCGCSTTVGLILKIVCWFSFQLRCLSVNFF